MCRGPPEGPRAASGWGEAGSLAAGRRAGMAGARAAAAQVHGQLRKHVVLARPQHVGVLRCAHRAARQRGRALPRLPTQVCTCDVTFVTMVCVQSAIRSPAL